MRFEDTFPAPRWIVGLDSGADDLDGGAYDDTAGRMAYRDGAYRDRPHYGTRSQAPRREQHRHRRQHTGRPQWHTRSTGRPQWHTRDTGRPQWNNRDTGRPQWNNRDTGRPQWNTRSTARPQWNNRDTGRPQWNTRSTARPQWNNRDTARPQWNTHDTGRPQWRAHDTGRPSVEHRSYKDRMYRALHEAARDRARAAGKTRVQLHRARPRHAMVTLSHGHATRWLKEAGLRLTSSGGCTNRHVRHCTSLDAVRTATVQRVVTLKRRSGCPVTITGGTETGHAPGAYSHGSGHKLDIGHNACIDRYIKKIADPAGTRGDGARLYRSPSGTVYADEGDHWDILFR
ncbi:hypothetical protein OUY22_08130 [Nonomuraea sp. MCN248]|uniref:Peptidase M15A C-terminal domain-containing protein n=1 Tax=Nonomuraea corallina TaxID=2989783 RepID=A0ABT4S843_9ACTN|nr:hypothetical protein [Nonomuraea corallina]MDA0633383.1 hypothetical protein [Nonomuraea corallina]